VKPAGAAWADDSGQGLAEYGLILALIATVCLVVITALGVNIRLTLTHIGSSL
jgi:pilus assembly protein Flp/PilA